ncbi:TspO/MBR family protein [Nocardioides zeicaulis]|uniref:TspO/MBR family protein n=1 Tax=Nocardioides zeicaulis TaxID=1776857 RepID=A0ABV6DZF3_9ACTN
MSTRDATLPPARTWWTMTPFLVAVAAVAGIGGIAAAGSQATYRALELPPYAPPSWLFGPVWSVLYLCIGVAGWLLWRAGGWDRVMWLWTVQLLLNLAWTPLFFAADLYRVALLEIVLLAATVGLLIGWSWHRSRVAGWLLVPYLAWVCFATALNAGIVVLN